jgi:hypothetical protein
MPNCDKFYVARLSAEKVITIIIEDTNDNSPEFVSVPTGLLTPATSPGSKITTVLATDRWEKNPVSVLEPPRLLSPSNSPSRQTTTVC